MAKRPSMQFYPGDWLKDPAVGQLSPAARGIWIDMICLMHEADECGVLKGSVRSLSRICRCYPEELENALRELIETGTADVFDRDMSRKCPGVSHESPGDCPGEFPDQIAVVCRRMQKDGKAREYERLRKRGQRSSKNVPTDVPADVPADVPKLSRLHSSSSTSVPPMSPKGDGVSLNASFDRFWQAYPRREAKATARKAWQKLKPDDGLVATMLDAIERFKRTDQWQRGIIPHPTTWLNQRRWEDELTEAPQAAAAGGGYRRVE